MADVVVEAPVEETIYKLESSDKIVLEITEKALYQSAVFRKLVEGLGYASKQPEERELLPVSNIDGVTLKKVVEWYEMHKEDAIVEDNRDPQPANFVIPEWDAEFLKIDLKELYDITLTADFLGIKKLWSYSCKAVAILANGKSPEELREMFGIPTDEEDAAADKAAKEAAVVEKAAKKAAGNN